MFDIRPIVAAGRAVMGRPSMTIGEYIQTPEEQSKFIEAMCRYSDVLRGAIVGAPADPEAFG